jgi:predicted metal-dependent hydrolase
MASEEIIKSLQEAIKKDDHNEVYEYSKMLLKESPEDEDYLQTFIISALKINVLDELTPIFKTSPVN